GLIDGNMAENVEMSQELSKLKKDILIEIIFTKRITDNVTVSEELKYHIEKGFENEGDVFRDAANVNTDNLVNVDTNQLYVNGLKRHSVTREKNIRKRKNKTVVIGTEGNPDSFNRNNDKGKAFQSTPIALIHLGRLSLNTSSESMLNYVKKTFSRDDFMVEGCPIRENAESMSF
ncbi:hypothetical protein HHI36_004527, partial [Cryptolaemus montrouzieri]